MAIVKFSTIREGKSPVAQDKKGRESMFVLFSKSTDTLIKFKGYDIKGVARIVGEPVKGHLHSKEYTIDTELQTYRWTQDFHSNVYVPYRTWQSAWKAFVKQSKFDVSFGAYEAFIRESLPDAATILDEAQLELELKEPSQELLLALKAKQEAIAELHLEISEMKAAMAMAKKAESEAERVARIQNTVNMLLNGNGKGNFSLEELQSNLVVLENA